MTNKKKHISYEERFAIEKLINAGYPVREISRILDRGISTIHTEITDNSTQGKYVALEAQSRSILLQRNKKLRHNKIIKNPKLKKAVEELLLEGLSPEKVSEFISKKRSLPNISPKSIRKFLRQKA